MFRPALLALPLTLLATDALAGQSQPASAWERDLPLVLDEAAIDLHIGLAGATARGATAWGANLTLPLAADGFSAAEEIALAAQLQADCEGTGLPAVVCAPIADGLTASIVDFNDTVVEAVPTYVAFDVGSWGWGSLLTGLYPMSGQHEYADGSEATWSYVLNNNDGAAGTFAAAGLALNGGGVTQGLACADVSGALITGSFPGVAVDGIDAQFLADRELACIGGAEGIVVAGTVGLAFGGFVSGGELD